MEGCAETYGRPVFSSSGRSFLRLLLLGLAFLASSLLLCPSCAGEFTVHPASVNTSLNSTVNFTCEATGVTVIYFLANGTATNNKHIEDKGFSHTQDTLLKVWAQAINNNTIISCVGEPGHINSTNAILMIQGQLASVGNLKYIYINGSCVLLSWTAPYTLDNVPITGYDIDDDSDRSLNTTDSSFLLTPPNRANPDVCNPTTVSVNALNEVGRGQPNNISFHYKRVPPTTPTTSVILTINDSRQLSLNISFDASGLCRGKYPNNIRIDILNADATSIYHTFNSLVIATGIYDIGYTLPDTVDRFSVNITWSNEGGQFDNVLFGPPGPVTNISLLNDSCNTIGISWRSPIGNDVEYYSLSIIDSLDGTLLNNTHVYSNSYQFENKNVFISRYIFYITGVNQFGEGVSNSTTFSYLKDTCSLSPSTSVSPNPSNTPTVTLTDSTSSGLSDGAIIGIVIAGLALLIIAAIIALVIIIYVVRKCKRKTYSKRDSFELTQQKIYNKNHPVHDSVFVYADGPTLQANVSSRVESPDGNQTVLRGNNPQLPTTARRRSRRSKRFVYFNSTLKEGD